MNIVLLNSLADGLIYVGCVIIAVSTGMGLFYATVKITQWIIRKVFKKK